MTSSNSITKTGMIIVLSVCICALSVLARPADNFVPRTHSHNGTTLPYRLLLPYNYDPSEQYPLILTLHGAGQRGTCNWTQIAAHGLAEAWAESTLQTRNPCFVVSPQCPPDNKWVDVDWNNATYNFDAVTMSNELETVSDILDSVIAEFPVDINRLYVTGLSMGGYGCWYMIMRYPDKFAAAIPMSGAGSVEKAGEIARVSVWCFHGALDGTVPARGSQEMVDALEDSSGKEAVRFLCSTDDCSRYTDTELDSVFQEEPDLLYTLYTNAAHVVWEYSYYNPRLEPWLFSKTLDTASSAMDIQSYGTAGAMLTGGIAVSVSVHTGGDAVFRITSAHGGDAALTIFNTAGKRIAALHTGNMKAGQEKRVVWENTATATGVHLYTITAAGSDNAAGSFFLHMAHE